MNPNPMMNPGGGAYYPQAPMLRPSGNRRAIKWVLGVFVLLFMLLAGRLTLDFIGYGMGSSAFQTGVLVAMLPVPVYMLLILWLDRYESEPLWMLALAFLWGATFAALAAIIINSTGAQIVAREFGRATAQFYGLVISAPIVEESSKAFVLFLLFFWKKDEFDGIMDGIVYAGMVGLGFAMTENIKYYGEAAMASSAMRMDHLTPTLIVRGGISPFAHPLFTSMTGIGLGWARQTHSKAIKFTMPLIGLILAICVHATWNYSAILAQQYGGAMFFAIYFIIMVPIFVAVIVSIFFALRREGRVVRDFLLYDLHRGLFTPQDYNRLCTVGGRMGASMRALGHGPRLWRTRMQYHQTASELAFHRCRIARGMIPYEQQSMEREAAYVQRLFELRRQLGPHL